MTSRMLYGIYHQRRLYYTPPVWLFEVQPDSNQYASADTLVDCLVAIDGVDGRENDAHGPLAALIVEDDPDLQAIFRTAASDAGFDVTTVETVRNAQQHLDSKNPQLVTLDMHLPDGLGTTILDRLRRENKAVFVILITFDIQTAQTVTTTDLVLFKPILFTQLRDAMKHIRLLL